MNYLFCLTFRDSVFATLAMLTVFGALTGPQAAQAQNYPVRPVRLIVPYTAGAGADLQARLAGVKLGQNLKQPIVVEIRPGGDTMIGTRAALQAPADGYTLLIATTTAAVAPLVHLNPGYRFDQLEVVMPLSFDGFMLSVSSSLPARNLAEFVAHVKANPGKLNQGALGASGPIELITDRFRTTAGLDMLKINYTGSLPALKDLAAGTIQVNVAGPVGTIPLFKSGHIRTLAYTGGDRNPLAPEIPTFKELGFPTIVGGVWYAVVASSTTPEPIKQRLARESMSILATADFKEKMSGLGSTPWMSTLQEFIAFTKSDLALWEADIKRIGVKPE